MDKKQVGRRLVTEADCRAGWAKATPTERKQIAAFIDANTRPQRLVGKKWVTVEPWKGVPYHLTTIRHLDTGRVFLTCGCSGPEAGMAGLSANQIRKVVGLPAVKGGDYKIAKARSVGDGVSLGEVKSKTRLPSRSKGGK